MSFPSKATVKRLAIAKNINFDVVPLDLLYRAVKDEYEHRDLVHNDPEVALQIVIDHLNEFGPLYYKALFEMIKEVKRVNRGKQIKIFNT